jgi:hypothetical protein
MPCAERHVNSQMDEIQPEAEFGEVRPGKANMFSGKEVVLARKSLPLCLAGLGIRRFDPIAEASELPDHSRRCASPKLGTH